MGKSTKRLRIVRVVFLDHCQSIGGDAELLPCEVFGVLYKETKNSLHIAAWIGDGEIDDNADTYAIAKKVVGKVKTLGWFYPKEMTIN